MSRCLLLGYSWALALFTPQPDLRQTKPFPDRPQTANVSDETLSPKTRRTRARLFEATADIISREGYAGWSEDTLCERCDCTRGTLRYQFPQGKYDLFPAFIRFALAQDASVAGAMSALTPRERLYLVLHSLRWRPPSATTVAMLEIWMASRGDTRLKAVVDPCFDDADGIVLGASSERDPEVVVLFNLLVGICLNSTRRDFDPKLLADSLDWLLPKLPTPPAVKQTLETLLTARARQSFDDADEAH